MSYDSYATEYERDDEPQVAPKAFAGSVTDLEDLMPFAGSVFTLADDDRRQWVGHYSAEQPGTLATIAADFGEGVYIVRTQAGYPHAQPRELEVEVSAPRRGRRGRPASPVLPSSDEAKRDEVALARAEAALQADRDKLREERERLHDERERLLSEARAARAEARDAEMRADAAKRALDAAREEVRQAESARTAARDEAADARAKMADLRMAHAEELIKTERRHMAELARLQERLRAAETDKAMTGLQLTMAESGEGLSPTDRLVGHLASLAERAAPAIAAVLAERFGGAVEEDSFEYESTGALPPYAGDGGLAPPDSSAVPVSYSEAPEMPASSPAASSAETPASSFAASPDVTEAAEAAEAPDVLRDALLARPGALSPAEIAEGVTELVRLRGSAEMKRIGQHTLALALEHVVEPAHVASYLAPILAPHTDAVRPLLSLPASHATTLLLSYLDVDAGRDHKHYITRVVKELKTALSEVTP